jgi:hypothetical protein
MKQKQLSMLTRDETKGRKGSHQMALVCGGAI